MKLEQLANDEVLIRILRKIVEVSKNKEFFEYHEIDIPVGSVSRYISLLTRLGIIKVYEKTTRKTRYTIAKPIDEIKLLVKTLETIRKQLTTHPARKQRVRSMNVKVKYPVVPPEDLAIPKEIVDKLFVAIEGHEEQKEIIKSALLSPNPVHLLLIGPPATSKSLILLDIYENVPGSMYILGSTSSKAGIRDLLIENRPTILLIDEIDKVDPRELDILLSIMESGLLVVTKHQFRATEKLWVKVFGACNDARTIPRALLSRFLPVEFPEYSEEEYKKVVVKVLTTREKIDRELAEIIADEVVKYTRDPRDAIQIARLVKPYKDVDVVKRFIKILAPNIKKKYDLLKYGRIRY